MSLLGPAGFTLDPANLTHDLFYVALVLFRLRTNQRRSVAKGGRLRPPLNGCVTGTHPPKLSVGGDRAINLADNVSDAFWSNLGAVLAIPRNFAMVARPERC